MSNATCCSPVCDRPAEIRGLCKAHYKRQAAGQPIDTPVRNRRKADEPPASCAASGCGETARHRGLCSGHYQRLRSGLPLDGPLRAKRKNGEAPADCSFPDCGRPVAYSKLCKTHCECWRQGLPLIPIRDLKPRTGTCAAPDCDRAIWASGLCGAHYVRVYSGTTPDQPIRARRRKNEAAPPCSADDCDKLATGSHGWCGSHWVTKTGKGAEYSARRRARKFDGPHEHITAADYRAMRAATGDCYLCGEALADPVEFDHVIPLARGGRHLMVNIKPVHRHCNRVKAARLLPDIREEVMI
jgi:5-methylcytosine-specific restriction endonuclease McrA